MLYIYKITILLCGVRLSVRHCVHSALLYPLPPDTTRSESAYPQVYPNPRLARLTGTHRFAVAVSSDFATTSPNVEACCTIDRRTRAILREKVQGVCQLKCKQLHLLAHYV